MEPRIFCGRISVRLASDLQREIAPVAALGVMQGRLAPRLCDYFANGHLIYSLVS